MVKLSLPAVRQVLFSAGVTSEREEKEIISKIEKSAHRLKFSWILLTIKNEYVGYGGTRFPSWVYSQTKYFYGSILICVSPITSLKPIPNIDIF